MFRWFLIVPMFALFVPVLSADEMPDHDRTRDVIYGRKFGTCLTMDVFSPKQNQNGGAVIAVVR